MHDLDFDHAHMDEAEREAISAAIWASDNVELTTVGIDIGSSTSHLMFSRVHMQRLATSLSSRFVVVGREVLWRSSILLTPYRSDYTIDAERLADFVEAAYAEAGLTRSSIDSGAVILTGEALKRHNARAIADLFSEEAGKFVCASAGHHLESAMAAHGSGAAKLSRDKGVCMLNVDIGGGTTKLALIDKGELVETIAIAVGGRLIVTDEAGVITRLEEPLLSVAQELGLDLALGATLSRENRARLVALMVDLLVETIAKRPPSALAQKLIVTEPWSDRARGRRAQAVTFSGGVAEFLYGREPSAFGDIGPDLALGLQDAIQKGAVAGQIWDPGQGIRATVIGAAQYSVQVSGSTVFISKPSLLPLRNVPVLPVRGHFHDEIRPEAVRAAIEDRLSKTYAEVDGPVAVAFRWEGLPAYGRLAQYAKGVVDGLATSIAAGRPIVLLIDGDVAMTLGRILHKELAPQAEIVAIDGVNLKEFDFVDIGEIVEPAHVVPVVIKSLLF
jgi:ethanolamine utilization protein EutA